jgi:hypothetical protein
MTEEISPYKLYSNWLFDGDLKKEIPKELLKYNSPISSQYAISMFVLNGKLNYFLNEHFNNIGLYYLEKNDLFKFLKKCVKDFKVQRNSIPFIPFSRREKIFEALRKKIPFLKNYDITLLSSIINSSEEKDGIYSALGLEKLEKPKKVKKTKEKNKEKIGIKEYMEKTYQVVST